MALPAPNDNMPRITTPPGTAIYPHLHAPDTRFDDPPGKYKVKLRFTGDAAEEMKEILREQMERSREFFVEGEGKADEAAQPWSIPTDDEGEELEGIEVKFTMKAGGVTKKGEKWSQSPAIFDAAGTPVDSGLKIGGGSVLRIAFEPYLYHGFGKYGVACWMKAVQVIDLQTWAGSRDADAYGFGEEDGGFSADEASDTYFAGDDDEDEEFEDDENSQDDDGLDAPEADF